MSEREENQEVNIDDFIPATKYMEENNLSKEQLKIQILAGRIHPYFFLDMSEALFQYLLSSVEDYETNSCGTINIYSHSTLAQDTVGFFEIPISSTLKLFRNESLPHKELKPVKLLHTSGLSSLSSEVWPETENQVKFSIEDIFYFLGYDFIGKRRFEDRAKDLLKQCQMVSLAIPEFSYSSIEKPIYTRNGEICGYRPPKLISFEAYKNPLGNIIISPVPKIKSSSLQDKMKRLIQSSNNKERKELTEIYDTLMDGNRYLLSAFTRKNIKKTIPLEPIAFENLYLSLDKKPTLKIQDLSNSKNSNNANLEITETQRSERFDNNELSHYDEILDLARAKFWQNYDPADPTTAPIKKQVMDFLIENGYSKSLATSADTILRGGRNRPN